MSTVPNGFLEAIGTALIEKNGEADGMEEAAAAAWQWLRDNPQERPEPGMMPIFGSRPAD